MVAQREPRVVVSVKPNGHVMKIVVDGHDISSVVMGADMQLSFPWRPPQLSLSLEIDKIVTEEEPSDPRQA